MLTMAFSSLFYGVLLDNKKPGKLGKRRPFILLGLPLWILTTILIWLPPDKPPQSFTTVIYWPAILWLWGLSFIRSLSRSLIMIALASMLPEQSQTLKNREDIAYVQTIFQIISSVLSVGIPMVLSYFIDIGSSQHWTSNGAFAFRYIFSASLIMTLFGTAFLLTTFFSVDEKCVNSHYAWALLNSNYIYKQALKLVGSLGFFGLECQEGSSLDVSQHPSASSYALFRL